MNLRDQLLGSLATLPGTREFHIHVLVSSPRKRSDLFPYAKPRPRVYLQDILILLSEQTTPDSPRILVTAIEASFYNNPATSCGILYISKVDSSGHATRPSPTAALVKGLLKFYADPSTRPVHVDHLWIQLFARAQAQYLFPNSSEFSGKRPLADAQLCVWWKRLLSDTTSDVAARGEETIKIRQYYVLPGFSELEAVHSLKISQSTSGSDGSGNLPWTYGHPYSQSDIPLPCTSGRREHSRLNLGHFIPSFDDDPKSRFMDEIAHTTNADGIGSPKQKRARTSSHGDRSADRPTSEQDDDEDGAQGELGKVTPDEFWERMSFRQECVSGVVTGFFAVGMSSQRRSRTTPASSAASPLAPQPGQVAPRMVRRVVATLLHHHEFSTRSRAVRATETLEGAIKGLCEDLAPVPSSPTPSVRHAERPSTPEPGPSRMALEVPCTPPPRTGGRAHVPDVSPNPFAEPVASLETYRSYIYGAVAVSNAPLPARGGAHGAPGGGAGTAPPVTVLAVRKKRKAPS
ncbi:uncharacterized protein FIBRA_05158 [Fibroporia radiculosa]|uniref:histone acetyltransferase n=1 Tax=Fibroporia radiculosa TaxID=599839 RepID=J4GQH4_9APHY|nr:uncharacterized protein FIBRA_05158 [Fibroporia radiculosa]CCM03040.1 predicted protein [Fibroporia radiculosa]